MKLNAAYAEGGPNLTTSPESVTLDSVVEGARSASGQAAETDASLLSLSQPDLVPVMVIVQRL